MPTYISLTLSRLDFMSPFYRLLIIPSNLTLFSMSLFFNQCQYLLVAFKSYDAYRSPYHDACVGASMV
jgi:hypothetical protein